MRSPIRVLFQSRSELFDTRGGDTFQIEHTKKALESAYPNYKIDINNDVKVKNIKDYDIVNLFNINWICETYLQALHAYNNSVPIVLSAIHHPTDKFKQFEDEYRFGLRRVTNTLVKSQSFRDIGKNIYRSFKYPKKAYPTLVQLLMGTYKQQRKVLEMSDIVLVQTYKEGKELKELYNVLGKPYERVVIGADSKMFLNSTPEEFEQYFNKEHSVDLSNKRIILSVGRIEPRKDQLLLIKAFNSLQATVNDPNLILIFIGANNANHSEYNFRFNRLVAKNANIYHTGALPQKIVASAMANNGVYVQTSWFETIGLTNVEAYMAGMPVLTTTDRLREFFDNKIEIIPVNDQTALETGLKKVLKRKSPTKDERRQIAKIMDWNETARQTAAAYEKILEQR